jgi:Secretion system C-terminal sorting domain
MGQKNERYFFQPIIAVFALALKATCASLDKVTLGLPTSYNSQLWSNNATESTVTAQNGKFNNTARDATGNYFFTSSVDVKKVFPTKIPIAFTKNEPSFCIGSSVDLFADIADYPSFIWSTGEVQKQITVKTAGKYTVRGINAAGCGSPESNAISPQVFPLPEKPIIYASESKPVCEGTSITLASTSPKENTWSTNEKGFVITIVKAGEYAITVKAKDENGCISLSSEPAKLTIKARPETPEISQIGAFTLLAKQKTFLNDIRFEWKKEGSNLSNNTSLIKATKPGFFTVTALQNFTIANNQVITCRSNLSGAFSYIPDITIKGVILYPNPTPNGIVTLEAQEDLSDFSLIVYSLKGQFIYSTVIPALTERRLVDLSFLSEGKYIVKLFNSSFQETKNIWIERK